jgi:hypothetical protein
MQSSKETPMSVRPPESEARKVITGMLVLTAVIAVLVAALPGVGVTLRSGILIVWIAVMLAVLRRYR